jgi:hypothetical protein
LPVWRSEIAVPGVVAEPHALALDPANNPYLLYYDPAAEQLRWAAGAGEAWVTSLVADDVLPDLELALAIGPDGVAQIAYIDDDDDKLIAGALEAGGWAWQTLSTANRNLALRVGQDNRPHLITIESDRLIYRSREGDVWRSEPASPDGVAVRSASLALDSQGRPTVVYFAPPIVGLTVAVRQSAGQWTTTALPYRGMMTMALGPNDAVNTLYVSERYEPGKPPWTFVSLWLAEQQGSDWQDTMLYEDLMMAENPDGRLLFDAAGRRHTIIRYPGGYLDYRRQETDGQGTTEGIAGSGGAFYLAVGSDGQPRLSRRRDDGLWFYRREILWLDKHMLLPVVPIKSPW